MKLSLIIVAVALIVFTSRVDAFSSVSMFKRSLAQCLKQFPVTVDEMIILNGDHKYNFKSPSKNMLCYLHCMDTLDELYNPQGDFDKAIFVKFMKTTYKRTDADIDKLLANCLPKLEVGADKCEKSLNFIACLHLPL